MNSRTSKILSLIKTQASDSIEVPSASNSNFKKNVHATYSQNPVECYNKEPTEEGSVAANNSCLAETGDNESCTSNKGLSCARKIVFEEDQIKENKCFNSGPQFHSSPVAGTSGSCDTSNVLCEHYVIENESSIKLKLRKVKQSYKKYCDSEQEPFGSGSSNEYEPDGDVNGNNSFSSSDASENIEHVNINNTDNNQEESISSSIKKGKKRIRNIDNWKIVKAKRLRNSGQQYKGRTGKLVKARSLKHACSDKCILSCSKKISEEFRSQLFKQFWDLGNFQRQRDFLGSCIEQLTLKYRRISAAQPRKPNCAFYVFKDGKKVRVCKTFLINTLGISEKMIRSVIKLKISEQGIIKEDLRGKHENHKTLDVEVSKSVFDHINSIPRIESHYVRKESTREFIDGGLTIAEMHRNYCAKRSDLNKPSASYDYYAKVFNTKFNIGFFAPKKDQCDLCETYKNTPNNTEQVELKAKYEKHLEEKDLSRKEKENDKKKAEDGEIALAIYDLQAVLPVPVGQSSAFFYKSRLNCYNFTITQLAQDTTKAFFWHEVYGNRGAIEIGTCVLLYLEELSKKQPGLDIVFFSDNCMGQQKNRFLIAVYIYAVEHFSIGTITHKFLIRGHTQNEADSIHSIIERRISLAKKSGPIYIPEQYISIIRDAKKKGKKIEVKEISFESFLDVKALSDNMGLNITKNADGQEFKINEVKILQFKKGKEEFYYKTSYKQEEWHRVIFTQRKRSKQDFRAVTIKKAYSKPFQLSENKKKDLQSLLNANIIPPFYKAYYESILK